MKNTLYSPEFEHDACGIGAVISIDGIPSAGVVDDALSIVERLEHRAGKDASGKVGQTASESCFRSRTSSSPGSPGKWE